MKFQSLPYVSPKCHSISQAVTQIHYNISNFKEREKKIIWEETKFLTSYSAEWNIFTTYAFLNKMGTSVPRKLSRTDGPLSLPLDTVSASHKYFSVLKSDMAFQRLLLYITLRYNFLQRLFFFFLHLGSFLHLSSQESQKSLMCQESQKCHSDKHSEQGHASKKSFSLFQELTKRGS